MNEFNRIIENNFGVTIEQVTIRQILDCIRNSIICQTHAYGMLAGIATQYDDEIKYSVELNTLFFNALVNMFDREFGLDSVVKVEKWDFDD